MGTSWKSRIASSAAILLLIGIVSVLYLLQSNWFRESVQHRIILAIESETGGKTELRSFSFNWRLLIAEMNGLVVHGTESREDTPLFQADLVQVRLRIVSLFRRDVHISSLQVEAPRLHLVLRPDGTTNIPGRPRITPARLVDQLLQLKLQHVALTHGLLQVNDELIPLDLTANDVALNLSYNRTGSRYGLDLASASMEVRWAKTQELKGSLQLSSQFARNQLTITKAAFRSEDSKIEFNGNLHNFAQPVIHWNIESQLAVSQIAGILRLEEIGGGTLQVKGSGYRDIHTPFAFAGEISGQHLSYLARTLHSSEMKFTSKLIADGSGIHLPDLDLAGSTLQWRGKAELKDYRRLALRGELMRLDLRTMAAAMGAKSFGWSAIARGPISMDGLLRPQMEDFAIKGDLQLSPAGGGVPVAGSLAFTYHQPNNLLELGESRLTLPNTEVAVAGVPGADLKVLIDSTDLNDLRPALSLAGKRLENRQLPALLHNGRAHFDGQVSGNLHNLQIAGDLALTNFQINGANWQNLRSSFIVGKSDLTLSSIVYQQDLFHGKAAGQIGLTNWTVEPNSALHLQGQFSGLDMPRLSRSYLGKTRFLLANGLAAGTFALGGTVLDPTGNAQVKIANLDLDGEHLDSLTAPIKLDHGQLQLLNGEGRSGAASVHFSGIYGHKPGNWQEGMLSLDLDSNVFPLSTLAFVRRRLPNVSAKTEIHGKTELLITPTHFQLGKTNGSIFLRNINTGDLEYGNLSLALSTRGQTMEGTLEGSLRSSHLSGTAEMQLLPEMPVKAQLQFGQLDVNLLAAAFAPAYARNALAGSVRGSVTLEGPLQQWEKIRAAIKLEDLQVTSPDHKANLIFRNSAPVLLEAANGTVTVQSMELAGRDTKFSIGGVVPFLQNRPMQLRLDGAVDLRIAELFNPNLQSSGESKISALLGGTLANPVMTGTLAVHNGSVAHNSFPNGLTDLNGTIQFDQNRATLQKFTAHSGGGNISLGGFLTFSAGHLLVYRLEADSQDVRLRYAGSVSVTSTSQLTLAGSNQTGILSGTATVSRVIFNPNADVGTLLASTETNEPIGEEPDFLSGLQLDIHVDSAPNLQLSTSLSRDVQATIDLQLRGNLKNPVLLGGIEADEGDIRVFGSRYSINRGQVSFTNPAKIEPVLDLDLRTQARGINVDITISGTLSKLNINYRSDPPLQPRDIIALLTVGRAPSTTTNTPNTQLTNNDVSALQSGANTLLGQAVSPTSNRLQKLFGITNIKIDPLVQGIANTSQARLTLEQQISRQITVTYVTNLSQTSEQIFRLEYALNPQFSLVALRDDNGEFGIDILYKKRFK